jgi:hypothetical protein
MRLDPGDLAPDGIAMFTDLWVGIAAAIPLQCEAAVPLLTDALRAVPENTLLAGELYYYRETVTSHRVAEISKPRWQISRPPPMPETPGMRGSPWPGLTST